MLRQVWFPAPAPFTAYGRRSLHRACVGFGVENRGRHSVQRCSVAGHGAGDPGRPHLSEHGEQVCRRWSRGGGPWASDAEGFKPGNRAAQEAPVPGARQCREPGPRRPSPQNPPGKGLDPPAGSLPLDPQPAAHSLLALHLLGQKVSGGAEWAEPSAAVLTTCNPPVVPSASP